MADPTARARVPERRELKKSVRLTFCFCVSEKLFDGGRETTVNSLGESERDFPARLAGIRASGFAGGRVVGYMFQNSPWCVETIL